MEDLDYIVDTIGKDREKDHKVRLIYNELVNEISETFGFHWIKPQDPQVTNQEKGESMEAGEVSNFNPTSETETNKHPTTTEKVIWKPQKPGERKHSTTKARKRKANSREDESAAILRNQKEIMKRLDKIEREKAQSDYNQSKGERSISLIICLLLLIAPSPPPPPHHTQTHTHTHTHKYKHKYKM